MGIKLKFAEKRQKLLKSTKKTWKFAEKRRKMLKKSTKNIENAEKKLNIEIR